MCTVCIIDDTACDVELDHNKYIETNDSIRHDSCTKDKPEAPIATEEVKERACDSLIMCIVTTMNQGLRNGGGIGDILRAPSSGVSYLLIITYLVATKPFRNHYLWQE